MLKVSPFRHFSPSQSKVSFFSDSTFHTNRVACRFFCSDLQMPELLKNNSALRIGHHPVLHGYEEMYEITTWVSKKTEKTFKITQNNSPIVINATDRLFQLIIECTPLLSKRSLIDILDCSLRRTHINSIRLYGILEGLLPLSKQPYIALTQEMFPKVVNYEISTWVSARPLNQQETIRKLLKDQVERGKKALEAYKISPDSEANTSPESNDIQMALNAIERDRIIELFMKAETGDLDAAKELERLEKQETLS